MREANRLSQMKCRKHCCDEKTATQKENDRFKKQKLRSEKGSDINGAVAVFSKEYINVS